MNSLAKPAAATVLMCAMLAAAFSVSAQTTTTATTTPSSASSSISTEAAAPITTQNERQLRLEEALVTAGTNASLSVSRQKRIVNLAANLSNRMDAVLSRFENIANRLESRMLKMEQGGTDTSAARVALADTRSSLSIAATLLKDIDTAVLKAVTANDPAAGISELRATYESVATALRQAHSSLRISLALLRTAPSTQPPSEKAGETVSETPTI